MEVQGEIDVFDGERLERRVSRQTKKNRETLFGIAHERIGIGEEDSVNMCTPIIFDKKENHGIIYVL